jgi:hypothetical protein
MLARRGIKAANEGLCLVVFDAELDRVRDILHDIAKDEAPRPEDLAQSVKNKTREKWDGLLTEDLLCKSFASRDLDVPSALSATQQIIGCVS